MTCFTPAGTPWVSSNPIFYATLNSPAYKCDFMIINWAVTVEDSRSITWECTISLESNNHRSTLESSLIISREDDILDSSCDISWVESARLLSSSIRIGCSALWTTSLFQVLVTLMTKASLALLLWKLNELIVLGKVSSFKTGNSCESPAWAAVALITDWVHLGSPINWIRGLSK